MMPTNVRADDQDILIEQGQKAPFPGVLVPEDSYRYYQSRVLTADELESYVTQPEVQVSKERSSALQIALPFLGGLLLGVIATSALDHK